MREVMATLLWDCTNQIEKDMKNTEWLKKTVKEMEKIEDIKKNNLGRRITTK